VANNATACAGRRHLTKMLVMHNAKSSSTVLTLLTETQLHAIVFAAVREALAADRTRDDIFDTPAAAKYMKTTAAALKSLVFRGRLVPDHRGGQDGLKSHRFRKSTLDAFMSGRQSP